MGGIYEESNFHLSKYGRTSTSKIWYAHGLVVLNPGSTYARLGCPAHLSRTSKKVYFNSSTPLFVYDNLSVKEILGLCVNSLKLNV